MQGRHRNVDRVRWNHSSSYAQASRHRRSPICRCWRWCCYSPRCIRSVRSPLSRSRSIWFRRTRCASSRKDAEPPPRPKPSLPIPSTFPRNPAALNAQPAPAAPPTQASSARRRSRLAPSTPQPTGNRPPLRRPQPPRDRRHRRAVIIPAAPDLSHQIPCDARSAADLPPISARQTRRRYRCGSVRASRHRIQSGHGVSSPSPDMSKLPNIDRAFRPDQDQAACVHDAGRQACDEPSPDRGQRFRKRTGTDAKRDRVRCEACQPYAMLPADRYGEWKVLDLSFTPQDFAGAS